MSTRWTMLFLTFLIQANLGLAQDIKAKPGTTPAGKEAFAENAPLREAGFNDAFYNGKQQRVREHYRDVPIGPLPANRQKEAVPLPPPATKQPRLTEEAGLNVSIVQNRPLTGTETSNATSTVCEPSLAVRGQEILFTGNWFASFSRDGGNTFQYRNPYTSFPTIPGRDFCCDQVAYYVPSHDLMVWFLQYVKNATGNTIRVAVAHGSDIANERWRFYDFTPQSVGNWGNNWFDYPDLGASSGSLFITSNSFNQANQFQRSVTLRLSLDELKSYAALNYHYFDRTDVGSLRLTQGASNIMYIGAHANTGTIRVFSWDDGSTTFQNKDFAVQPWIRGGASCPGPDGRDWLGFVDGRITAAWAVGSNQGFAWTSAQGGSFPQAHVRAAIVDWNAGTVVKQPHIWNASVAFAYPAAAVNSNAQVGVSLAYGSNAVAPSHTVGVLRGDLSWSLQATVLGTNGPSTNRWGDYLTVRANGQTPSRFACTGFTLNGSSDRKDIVPRLVQFDAVESKETGTLPKIVTSKKLPVDPKIVWQTNSPLDKVLAAEKKGRFSKTPRSTAASEKWMKANATLFSPNLKKTVLTFPMAADFQKYHKLASLPPAYSFFYETPETVCFPDDRLQVVDTANEPWNINCQLIITFQDGSQAIGTGWFAGPRLVVTAGHCVHESEGGNFFKSVEVIPGMNSAIRPFGSQISTLLRASEEWKKTGTVAADYGAIILPAEFKTSDGKKPGIFPALTLSDAEISGRMLTISGYPADKLFGTQWQDSGPVGSILPARLSYSIDTFGGHSGSAVVSKIKDQLFVLGIHNYGGCPNRCTRITAAVKKDLDQWLADSTTP